LALFEERKKEKKRKGASADGKKKEENLRRKIWVQIRSCLFMCCLNS